MLLYNALVHVSGLIKYDKMKIDHHLKSNKQKGKTKSGQTFKKKKMMIGKVCSYLTKTMVHAYRVHH